MEGNGIKLLTLHMHSISFHHDDFFLTYKYEVLQKRELFFFFVMREWGYEKKISHLCKKTSASNWVVLKAKADIPSQGLCKIVNSNHLPFLLHLGTISRRGKWGMFCGGYTNHVILWRLPLRAEHNGCWSSLLSCYIQPISQ